MITRLIGLIAGMMLTCWQTHAADINAETLLQRQDESTLWVIDIRSDIEQAAGVPEIAFIVTSGPDSLGLPDQVTELVVIAPLQISLETESTWNRYAEQHQLTLHWLKGTSVDWQNAGLELIRPDPQQTNSITSQPRYFLIPRGICELAEPAMVIDKQSFEPKPPAH